MYDWPEFSDRTDAFWKRIARRLRDRGIDAPAALTREASASGVRRDPDLILGQTCGLPLIRGEAGEAIPFARPTHAIEGCGPGTYSSILLARKETGAGLGDFRGRRAAVNEPDSQSGCNALKDAVAGHSDPDEPFFGSILITGAHRASADAVADGRADLCALDAVAWALYRKAEPARAARLDPLLWTRPMPSPPFIASPRHADAIPCLLSALAESATGDAPGIPVGVLPASEADYDPIRRMDDRLNAMKPAPEPKPERMAADSSAGLRPGRDSCS